LTFVLDTKTTKLISLKVVSVQPRFNRGLTSQKKWKTARPSWKGRPNTDDSHGQINF
jgi:hypothetical protein